MTVRQWKRHILNHGRLDGRWPGGLPGDGSDDGGDDDSSDGEAHALRGLATRGHRCCSRNATHFHSVGADWQLDVLEVLRTAVLKFDFQFVGDLAVGVFGHQDAARIAHPFEPHRHVDAAMSLSLLKFVGQASLVDDAMLPS